MGIFTDMWKLIHAKAGPEAGGGGMRKGVKRYVRGSAALLFLIMALTGCDNGTYMKVAGIVKGGSAFSFMLEPVYQPEQTGGDENTGAGMREADKSDDMAYTDIPALYGRFLDGELTIEQEGHQVCISELFWDNDIEYCFLDIDGDGREELHIRDSAVYYVVDIGDRPRILFQGWWSYEPVVTDELCGILYYYKGYGSERIKFMKVNADGSTESDGEFCWFDENQNGNLDEADSFYGRGDLNMEQYVRYREAYVTKRTEQEPGWKDKRIKNYETWREAYIDFIRKETVMLSLSDSSWCSYSLIYVDDDDIPELFFFTGSMAGGEVIVSFYDGSVRAMNRERSGMKYIEHGGLLYNGNGNTGFYPCNIYMLEKGVFSEIGTGWYAEHSDEEGSLRYEYFWEGKAVTEAEFEAHIDELIDREKCVEPSVMYSEKEMLERLAAE